MSHPSPPPLPPLAAPPQTSWLKPFCPRMIRRGACSSTRARPGPMGRDTPDPRRRPWEPGLAPDPTGRAGCEAGAAPTSSATIRHRTQAEADRRGLLQ
eukprot:4641158-Pyramimonas_sp.AAC.1